MVMLATAGSACATNDPGVRVRGAEAIDQTIDSPLVTEPSPPVTDDSTPPPSSVELNPNDAPIDFGANKTPQPYDEFLQASLADIQEYWRETYPQVYGSAYEELGGGIYAAYPDRSESIPGCGNGNSSTYEEVAEGGAFYCEFGDFIAYDDAVLVPDFSERLGNSAIAIVLAHEFGHAIQNRSGVLAQDLATVNLEQQADCFAGAWTAHVARGESPSLTFGDTEVKSGLIAMVEVKDPIGASVFDPNAHGSAFDRVGAFQVGFLEGAQRCSTLIDDPLPLLNLQFNSNAEAATGGDLPYLEVEDAIVADLTRFWTKSLTSIGKTLVAPAVATYSSDGPYPACEGVDATQFRNASVFCANTNQIAYDEDFARQLYRTFGDFAVGYLIGLAWSDAVHVQLGSTLTGEDRALANDCLTGAWTQDTIPANQTEQQLLVSPGDLDEVVSTALVMGDDGQSDNIVGSGFEKIASYRSGVLGGIDACAL